MVTQKAVDYTPMITHRRGMFGCCDVQNERMEHIDNLMTLASGTNPQFKCFLLNFAGSPGTMMVFSYETMVRAGKIEPAESFATILHVDRHIPKTKWHTKMYIPNTVITTQLVNKISRKILHHNQANNNHKK